MRKTSVSDLIREMVEQVLTRKQEAQTRRMYDALFELRGVCKEDLGDVSSHVDDILYGPQGAWKGRHE